MTNEEKRMKRREQYLVGKLGNAVYELYKYCVEKAIKAVEYLDDDISEEEYTNEMDSVDDKGIMYNVTIGELTFKLRNEFGYDNERLYKLLVVINERSKERYSKEQEDEA